MPGVSRPVDSFQQHVDDNSSDEGTMEQVGPQLHMLSRPLNNLTTSEHRASVSGAFNIRTAFPVSSQFSSIPVGSCHVSTRRHMRSYGRRSVTTQDDLVSIEDTQPMLQNHPAIRRLDMSEDTYEGGDSSDDSTIVKDGLDEGIEMLAGAAGSLFGDNRRSSYNDRSMIGGSTSFCGAVFIVCNAALGIAVLNLPYALLSVGNVYVALLVQCISVVVVWSTLFFLGFFAEKCQVSSYEAVVGTLWGPKVKVVVELILVLYAFVSCIMYLITTGDQMEKVLDLFTKENKTSLDKLREISIVVSTLLVLPMCIPKDISYLSYPGLVSVLGVLYVPFAVVLRYSKLEKVETRFEQVEFSCMGLVRALPSVLIAYQCHLSCVPAYASLRHRSPWRWMAITAIALCIVSFIYAVVALFGFMTFGDLTQSDVFLNYDSDDKVITVGRIALMCAVLLSYPSMHFVGRSAYESLFQTKNNPASSINAFFSPAWLLGSLAAALFIPKIGSVIERIGPVAAFFILGFPGLCLVQLSRYRRKHWLAPASIGIFYAALCTLLFTCAVLSFFFK